jgi:hypothetical protein
VLELGGELGVFQVGLGLVAGDAVAVRIGRGVAQVFGLVLELGFLVS